MSYDHNAKTADAAFNMNFKEYDTENTRLFEVFYDAGGKKSKMVETTLNELGLEHTPKNKMIVLSLMAFCHSIGQIK